MYEVPIIRSVEGNTIVISHPVIPDQPDTFLTSASLASAVTLTVLDNGVFANTNYIITGPVGMNRTELVTINGAITPGSSITITAATFPHPADTPVVKTLWNQIEISGATTILGSKTVITTTGIQFERRETTYTNTGTTYAFYFVRFKNSTSSAFSEYSDPAGFGGYDTNTVRAIKDEALRMTKDIIGKVVSNDWLNQEIFNCEQEVWTERKRWKWATKFDAILGDMITGQGSIALPADIADSFSDQSIYGLRVGGRPNMDKVTKGEFDNFYINGANTTLALPVNISDSTITLTDSSDFDDSGSIAIQDSSYTYTANSRSTGVLTLAAMVTLAADVQVAGTDVWQSVAFGDPTYYTVWDGRAYFSSPVSNQWKNHNIVMDYYSKPTVINSDSDTVNIPDFTLYHYYLAWKIALARTNGEPTNGSQNFMNQYMIRKANLKRIENSGQRASFRPRLNRVSYPSSPDVRIIVTPGDAP